jgi:hypothetical protein
METELKDKVYWCNLCDYKCYKPKHYSQHLLTQKHIRKQNALAGNTMETQKKTPTLYECNKCNIAFKTRSGLWKHSHKCVLLAPPQEKQPIEIHTGSVNSVDMLIQTQTTLILELVKQNQEFKQLLMEQSNQMMEQNKTMIEVAKNSNVNNTNNNTNTNSHNKTFNLQFFLNETCKNAMNMSDFIETIDVQMNELENIGHNGYVAGMTDIILSRIKDLDVSKRPVHCTDLKRETMYIKDHNEWNKDTTEKSYLRKAISMVSKKNCGKTMEWRERNPECLEIGSPKYDFCFKMMRNVLGDFEDVQIKLDNKIIKNLAKEVVVDR